MQRRNFLQLTGVSLAGILCSSVLKGASQPATLLALPDEVWISTYGTWQQMKAAGAYFSYRDMVVNLPAQGDGLRVILQSPTQPIDGIRLKWKYATEPNAKVLGDHYERSYGDLSWGTPTATRKAPWYILIHDGQQTNGFGVKTGAHSICYWQVDPQYIELTLDTHSGGQGVVLGQRALQAASIITMKGSRGDSPFESAQRFCKQMCAKPVLPKQPVYGINDWYFAYGNNSDELIMEHTKLLADLAPTGSNRPFSVIDAGWAKRSSKHPDASAWGDDQTQSNEKFKDMGKLAANIKATGMRPGLWTRVLCASEHDKKNVLAPPIPGRDDPNSPILDPTIPENLDRIANLFKVYNAWGYEMVKHDFSSYDIFGRWGVQMDKEMTVPGWHYYDQSKTNAEIILQLYSTIRKAAGSIYIIGCNTMSHLSAGLFELNRIGDDTSGHEWDRTRKMGVNTLAFRIDQHKAFYSVDGDCVGLTKDISWDRNKQWMQLLAESGAPLFISAQPDALGAEQKQFIKQSFAQAAKEQPTAEPLDWETNMTPTKWKLNGRQVQFDWA